MEQLPQDRNRLHGVLVLVGVLVIFGIVGYGVMSSVGEAPTVSETPGVSPASAATSVSATETGATVTPTPTSQAATREFACSTVIDSKAETFATLEEVWASGDSVRFCEVTGLFNSTLTPAERGALDVYKSPPSAPTKASDSELLGYIYRTCMRQDGPYTVHVHADQINEPRAALVLCPEAPHAPALQAAVDAQIALQERKEADAAEIAAGTAFPTGSYRVGMDGGIPPGTYVSESDAGYLSCYWERLDSAGDIIDNNFATDVYRLEVTLDSGDYSFKTDGCGTWRLAA